MNAVKKILKEKNIKIGSFCYCDAFYKKTELYGEPIIKSIHGADYYRYPIGYARIEVRLINCVVVGAVYLHTRWLVNRSEDGSVTRPLDKTKKLFIKVRQGWLNAEILVDPNDIVVTNPVQDFLILHLTAFPNEDVRQSYIKEMAKIMADHPRNKKGRWIRRESD